jgi:small subunit ribosomal protein S14
MARQGLIENNNRRKRLIAQHEEKRNALKLMINDRSLPLEERVKLTMKLSELPRNSSPVRYRLRCVDTGRARGNYRFCKLSRIKFREEGMRGRLPGIRRASW